LRKTRAVIVGIMASLMVCPALLSAQEEAKPVILLYHGPKTGEQDLRIYGEALARVINEDPRMKDKAEIVLVGDQDLMNTLLYFPQVKCVVVALTTWELKADRIVPSLLWYFNQGGAIVGMGNAGNGAVTKALNGSIFPLFGNQYRMPDPSWFCKNTTTGALRPVPTPVCKPGETRISMRQLVYVKTTDHPIAEGVADQFMLNDSRFVIHMNTTGTPTYQHLEPAKGTYTQVFSDSQLGAPLVVVYEENGTSVTFAGTDKISVKPTDDSYFERAFLGDPNFKKLFQNAVYFAWNKEKKYTAAMERAKEEFARMKQEEEDLKARVEESLKKEKSSKLMRSVLLIVVGVVLIVIISYFCFVIPARQRRAAAEQAPPETPTQKQP